MIRHSSALATDSSRLLEKLAERPFAEDLYLAGSAALTLYLGHRPIRDLDLMSQVRRLRAIERRDLLQEFLDLDAATQVETARDGFLNLRLSGELGLRLYHYPYPLVETEDFFRGLAVASPIDLGLMKLGAIISRGARRDFVDLYLLCREISLARLLDRAADKFGHVRDFRLQALKGLSDLSQVEDEPMPKLTHSLDWQVVVDWLQEEVRQLGRQYLKLG